MNRNGVTTHLSYAKPLGDQQLLIAMGAHAAVATGFATLPPFGGPIIINGSGGLQGTVAPGNSIQLSIGGLMPGEGVHIVVHSTLVDLGWSKANSKGTLTYKFTVPAGLAAGAHELVFITGSGNLTVPFAIKAPAAPELAATGTNTWRIAWLGVVLLILGLALYLPARRQPQ